MSISTCISIHIYMNICTYKHAYDCIYGYAYGTWASAAAISVAGGIRRIGDITKGESAPLRYVHACMFLCAYMCMRVCVFVDR